MNNRKKVKILVPTIVLLAITVLIALVAYIGISRMNIDSYRLEYSEYVEKYSEEFSLDKMLVYSFIKTESSFNEKSLSDAGARGLMQIMPDTYEWIKFRLSDEDTVSFDDMFDARTNIRYGCCLLSYISEKFNTITEVAAAYHAGTGAVSEWLSDARYSKDGKLVFIPIPETAHYADKIKKAYGMYCRLYNK